MATTVTAAFREFQTRMNISDRQESIVSACRKNVVGALGAKLSLYTLQPSLLIGAYARDTMPRLLTEGDVDVMVVLDYQTHSGWYSSAGTRSALARFRDILSDAYPKTAIRVDRNCVVLKFYEFELDAVPAFKNQNGYHEIPDTYRAKWVPTNPVVYVL